MPAVTGPTATHNSPFLPETTASAHCTHPRMDGQSEKYTEMVDPPSKGGRAQIATQNGLDVCSLTLLVRPTPLPQRQISHMCTHPQLIVSMELSVEGWLCVSEVLVDWIQRSIHFNVELPTDVVDAYHTQRALFLVARHLPVLIDTNSQNKPPHASRVSCEEN